MNVSTTLNGIGSWFRPAAAPQPLRPDDVGPWPALAEGGRCLAPDGYEPAVAPAGTAAPPNSGQAATTAAQAGSTVPGPIGAAITPLVKQQLEGVVDRLAARGFKFEARLTDGTLKQNMVKDGTWRFDAISPQGASVVLMDLDDMRVLDGVEGAPTLTKDEKSQLQALEALYARGYKRECQQYHDPIHPASLINTLRDGYSVYLYPKDAANPHTCKSPDHLHALAFFEGVGSSERLANPALAETLKAASDRGMHFHTQYLEVAPHQVYRESAGPSTEVLVSKRTVPVKTTEAALTSADVLEAHLDRVDAAYTRFLEPVLSRHKLGFEKDYLPTIARADDPISVDVRVAVAAAMVDRYKQVIHDQGIFTREVNALYGAIRERATDAPELVRMAIRVMSRIDRTNAGSLVTLAKESSSLTKFSPDDPLRTSRLEKLLNETGSLTAAMSCLDALDGPRESLDARVDRLLFLRQHLPAEERERVADHYKAMQKMAGDSDDAKYEAYLTAILTNQLRGSQEETWDDVGVAAPKPQPPAGKVEVADDFVMVGGLRVPRRA